MKQLELEYSLVISSKRINKKIDFTERSIRIFSGHIVVKKGFRWDGCTWARDGKKRWDGKPITADASCIHDALLDCYYNTTKDFPLNKKTIDQIFRDELIFCGYKFLRVVPVYITAYVYYFGVHYLNRIPDLFKEKK